ncbi:alpha/beta fold hydrolase [Stenotrophomonas sp. C3(2023)]|uniref:alpha/beta fold hydrolase n=1 Tax=Stenotrophomonas sp. C3(2023) TaxID=3080277 RepID=UPI00293CC657|nr:alpha/beta fold hydrolase [Stenotrophomonas sp. C3(2023)]MDV3468277.1 alpha/beta fold hydrolase [Stenotrophomonas sp. C3(2023)]
MNARGWQMGRKALWAMILLLSPMMALAARPQVMACPDDPSPLLRGAHCATVEVPLRHAEADGEAITLFVRRIPADTAVAHRGEVWLLSGGPGEAGASLYPSIPTYQKAFPGYDLVIPDHRGTGRSTRICPAEEAPQSPEGTGLAGSEWSSCIGSMYANLPRTSAFSITEAAHDLGVLMAGAHERGQVLLYGVSYGTQLALRALQVNELAVDGLILDGLVPPEATDIWDLSRRTALVDDVGRQSLDAASLSRYRTLLTVKDAAWQKDVPGGDLRRFFAALLSFPALRERMPQIIAGLGDGDTTALTATVGDWHAALAALGQSGDNQPALPLVMLVSASENNARPALTQAMVDEEARDALFVSPIPGLLVGGTVPRYPRDAWFGKSPQRLPRTLVVHGTLDPNTGYASARQHAAILARAGSVQFHTVERGAHLLPLVAPHCFSTSVQAFVVGGTAPQRCVEPVSE